ncbi:MAG: glycosyltransferase [Hyphomicrobiales bacterium]|nr:MAG: glycosyltransferase [Hyphomicrobiales bacterium]
MISVLTLVKNRTDHLNNLVEGLRRSTVAPAELVIVDMSDPPVPRMVADFPITLIRLETDGLPLAQARNLAAASAGTDRLLFLDVDCIPGSDLVAAMASALDNQDALICAEVRYLASGDTKDGDWCEVSLKAAGLPHPVRRFPACGLAREPNYGLFWSLAFGISSAAFARIGGFDEGFTGYGAEDTDFAFRAREACLKLLFLGGASAYHQYHGVVDPPLQHFIDIVRNAQLFHGKWGVWPMEGWLESFVNRGFVNRSSDALSIIRHPSMRDVDVATCPRHQRF